KIQSIDDAIVDLANWLMHNACADAWGPNWPHGISLVPTVHPTGPAQAGWCYGSPGVASTLCLAGRALGRQAYIDFAVAAMEAVFQRPSTARCLETPSFCHGLAGLLHIAARFTNLYPTPAITRGTAELFDQLAAMFDASTPFGFRSVERDR